MTETKWYDMETVLMYKNFEEKKMTEFADWSMRDHMMQQAIKYEKDCLKQVLTQLLGREPTIEDAKECQKIMQSGNHEKYIISHKGVQLGSIKRIFDANNFKVVFTPNDCTF